MVGHEALKYQALTSAVAKELPEMLPLLVCRDRLLSAILPEYIGHLENMFTKKQIYRSNKEY